MPCPSAVDIALALSLNIFGSESGVGLSLWLNRDCGSYEPPPVYVYDHSSGPTWTGNGWAYLPIGQYRPLPGGYMPPPPPPGYLGHMPPHSDPNGIRRLLPF